MNPLLSFFKSIAVKTCVIFTVIFLALFTIGVAIDVPGWTFGLDKVYMILLFSFLLSACSYILRITSIPVFASYILHFLACGFSYYLLFVGWLGFSGNAGMTLMILFLFVLLYAVWLGLTAIFKGGKKKKEEKKIVYESQFKGAGKKK